MKQIAVSIIDSGGSPVTGLTLSNFEVRVSPYSSAEAIAGLHLTEIGTHGNYVISDFTSWYPNIKVYVDTGSGFAEQTWIGIQDVGDLTTAFLRLSGGTMTGNIAMGGNKVTGAGAGTTNGDLVRFEQAILTTGTQTKAGQLYFDTTAGVIPIVLQPSTTGYPTNQGHVTSKYYVDTLFGSAVGVVQSGYLIKLIPSRATEDVYSKATMEKCNTYLSGLSNIATYTGTILVEPLAQASNLINVDDGSTAWISPGVYIQGVGSKPIINRRAPNSSLTVAGGLINCHILDNNVVSARAYTNFTFENCTFDVPDATDVTFTTCKFKGVNKFKSDAGGTLTMSNCTGDLFIYNDDIGTVSISGTQPAQVISTSSSNFDY